MSCFPHSLLSAHQFRNMIVSELCRSVADDLIRNSERLRLTLEIGSAPAKGGKSLVFTSVDY